ncbi:MAG: glycosyltransferase family 4 protein [Saprospiraceae bacterium]|nr:glycosyltransferase family 4 protein [Saprospiraceae bacterium]
MKKIVIISPAHPLRGGIAASTERLATTFRNEGHRVTIISFSLQYPEFLFPGKTQYTDDPPPENLKILPLINAVNPFNWFWVANFIMKLKPDVVVSRYWLPFMAPCIGTIQFLMRMFTKSRVVGIVDNAIPHEKRFGDKFFSSYYFASCNAFVTLSELVAKDLAEVVRTKKIIATEHPLYDNYGEKVAKEEARKVLGIQEKEINLILFFGFIREYKGLDLLVEAVAKLKDSKYRVLIAGEYYGNEAYFQKLYRTLEMEPQLYLHTDYIPNDKIKYYFSAADVVVQPYKSATQSGISQIAYHFDIPMIVSNVGALPDMVIHNNTGLIVNPETDELAVAIKRYFDENLAPQFSINCNTFKKKFSWEKLSEAVFEAAE